MNLVSGSQLDPDMDSKLLVNNIDIMNIDIILNNELCLRMHKQSLITM